MKNTKSLDQALLEQGMAYRAEEGKLRMASPAPNHKLIVETLDMVRYASQNPIEEDGVLYDWDQSRWSRVRVADGEVLYADEEHFIEAGPEEASAGCNTSYCFAGWALHLAGVQFQGPDRVKCTADTATEVVKWLDWDESRDAISAESAGRALLGLTEDQASDLFHGTNDLERIEEVIKDIFEGAYEDEGVPA
jgi:hypothetical protein